MNGIWLKIKKHKWVSIPSFLGLIFVLAGGAMSIYKLKDVPGPLIVHFNNYVGIDRTGGLSYLYMVCVLGVLMVVSNLLIGLELDERNWFFGKLTGFFGLILGLLIFMGFIVIMNVN